VIYVSLKAEASSSVVGDDAAVVHKVNSQSGSYCGRGLLLVSMFVIGLCCCSTHFQVGSCPAGTCMYHMRPLPLLSLSLLLRM